MYTNLYLYTCVNFVVTTTTINNCLMHSLQIIQDAYHPPRFAQSMHQKLAHHL